MSYREMMLGLAEVVARDPGGPQPPYGSQGQAIELDPAAVRGLANHRRTSALCEPVVSG